MLSAQPVDAAPPPATSPGGPRALTPEERALVDLHHRLAGADDDDYQPEQLLLIADEMRQVRAAPTPAEAIEVIAWWGCDELGRFVARARLAKLRVRERRAPASGRAGGARGRA